MKHTFYIIAGKSGIRRDLAEEWKETSVKAGWDVIKSETQDNGATTIYIMGSYDDIPIPPKPTRKMIMV
jgi:hypothetical protein